MSIYSTDEVIVFPDFPQDRESSISVLIVDDELHWRVANRRELIDQFQDLPNDDLQIVEASNVSEMFNALKNHSFHLILLDCDLGLKPSGQRVNGLDLIPEVINMQPTANILVVTGDDSTKSVVRAIQAGAKGFLEKKTNPEYIKYRRVQIKSAIEEAKKELKFLRTASNSKSPNRKYICKSPAMKKVEYTLENLAHVSIPVLISGESGLGKTATAKRLSELRAFVLKQPDRPFLNVNISALETTLLSSTLFGHEKGAFTGATQTTQGLFQIANGGDLFLDEIGDATPELQAKLLKVIEEREFRRVGGKTTLYTNARLIFATNKNLKKMVEEGSFREDLYARISSFEVTLPSMKDRRMDIAGICAVLIEKLCSDTTDKKFDYSELPTDLKEYLHRPEIPLNIRGLENDLSRIMVMCPKGRDDSIDFRSWKSALGLSKRSVFRSDYSKKPLNQKYLSNMDFDFFSDPEFPGLSEVSELFEKRLLLDAQKTFKHSIKIANVMKISQAKLHRKLKKYGINPREIQKKGNLDVHSTNR